MKQQKLVSVILPSYNERENILRLIPGIFRAVRRIPGWNAEIIIVDDNSPDGTAPAVRTKYGSVVRIIVRKNERGLAGAIATGIRKAKGSVIIGMDADGNHDPSHIPALLKGLASADLVVGSRFFRGGGMRGVVRYVVSWLFNRWAHRLGFPVSDSTSGFYAIKTVALRQLGIGGIYHGYGEYHLRLVWCAKQYGIRIAEIPVIYGTRTYGQSKSRLPIMLITYTRTALQLLHQTTA